MTSPLIPGTNWASEEETVETFDLYVFDKVNSKYIPLLISHDNKNSLELFYPLIAKDLYCDIWRTINVGEQLTGIQNILIKNNIDFEDYFIVVAFDSDKNIISKAKLSNPDKVELLISPNEGGGV